VDISAVLTVAAEVAGASGLVTVSSSAATWMKERARLRQRADSVREMLGLMQGSRVAYRHDSRHVLYIDTNRLHPDNLHGLAAASGNDYLRARRSGRVRIEDDVRTDTACDLVLIGSPTAEGLSRLVFGYRPDGDADSLVLDQAPVDLPFRWVISKNLVDPQAVARRFVAGRGMVERPNWRIEGPRRVYVPRVDENGLLLEDYLLVTKLRNYLSRGAFDEGYSIVSFGGTHGTGTRALELIFKDKDIIGVIGEQLRSRPAAFQMLFRIYDIDHNPSTGSRARGLHLVEDVTILPDSEQIWRTAAQILERSTRDDSAETP
jgi:hypothetical protein